MHRDIRATTLFKEAEDLYQTLRKPGTGQVSDAADICVSPDGRCALFTGYFADQPGGGLSLRICKADLQSGAIQVLTFGPGTDRLPKYSPDGRLVAFLSDRHKTGDFQLYLLDSSSGAAHRAPQVPGWVEYLEWSPDGLRILLGVAGHGADVSSGQGAVSTKPREPDVQSWMPTVESGQEEYRRRRVWVYELAGAKTCPVGPGDMNVWEASWCGSQQIAVVNSHASGEGHWYTAGLHIVDLCTGVARELYLPREQLGCLKGSPSGAHLAVVEALCSDRWIVAGDLQVIDLESREVVRVSTRAVDVTHLEWRSDRQLLVAGHRGFETVVGICDILSGTFDETWSSSEVTTGGRYVSVAGWNESADCVLIGESFVGAPEIGVVRNGRYRAVRSLSLEPSQATSELKQIEQVRWTAPDGLEIQGWLLRPKGAGTAPFPVVMYIHGGPVWHWRPTWLGRNALHALMLLKRGYAVFMPNPRGSAGRGQDFAGRVRGDLNGADTYDLLSGLDALVAAGSIDPARIGVTGISYGGNMTSWLVTQDQRFAAAVAISAHTDQVSQHLVSNIPDFDEIFFGEKYNTVGGKYYARSAIMHAERARTPTLNIAGALDRCTPPNQAVEFHNALLLNGSRSSLVVYPEEGHGIRGYPAALDCAARIVDWFVQHMPSASCSAPT